jgi:hypothetical protein
MEEYYQEYFHPMGKVTIKRINEIDEQRKGYDVLIIIDDGEQYIKVEEKADRFKSPNIVLELWSDLNHKLGWLYTMRADMLAYHYTATGITHMIPVCALKRAFSVYEPEWRDTHRIVLRQNRGWTTQILLLPLDVMWDAIRDVSIHDHAINHGERW